MKQLMDVNIDIKNSIPYKYFFKKIEGKVYRFSKIGAEKWRADLMPFDELPYCVWND